MHGKPRGAANPPTGAAAVPANVQPPPRQAMGLQICHLALSCTSQGQQMLPQPFALRALQQVQKTAEKWQKCKLVSGMASVASDMGRL